MKTFSRYRLKGNDLESIFNIRPFRGNIEAYKLCSIVQYLVFWTVFTNICIPSMA